MNMSMKTHHPKAPRLATAALLIGLLSLVLSPLAIASTPKGDGASRAAATSTSTGKSGATGAKDGASDEATKAGVDAAALAMKVQRFYESTTDFAADFEQSYRYRAMRRTQNSSGAVEVKKPGLMRWDYSRPYPRHFVLDGKALYIFDPEDNAVMVNREFTSDGLSAAVTFLWGRGNLSDEFDITLVQRADYGSTVLELVPKTPQPGFTRLFFSVDPDTGAVLSSVVIDSQGNENRITFKNVRTNTGIDAKRFQFEIPKGAVVQELG